MALDLHILGISGMQFLLRKDNLAGGSLEFHDLLFFLSEEPWLGFQLNNRHLDQALKKFKKQPDCTTPVVGLRLTLTYGHIEQWTRLHISTLNTITELTKTLKIKYLYIHPDHDFGFANTFKRLLLALELPNVEYFETTIPPRALERAECQPELRTLSYGVYLNHGLIDGAFQLEDEVGLDRFLGTEAGQKLDLWAGSVPVEYLKYFDKYSKLEAVKTVELRFKNITNIEFDQVERKCFDLFEKLTLTGLAIYAFPLTFDKQFEIFELIDSQSESLKRIWTTPKILSCIIDISKVLISKVFANTEIIFFKQGYQHNFNNDPAFEAKFPRASFRIDELWTQAEIAADHPHSKFAFRSIPWKLC